MFGYLLLCAVLSLVYVLCVIYTLIFYAALSDFEKDYNSEVWDHIANKDNGLIIFRFISSYKVILSVFYTLHKENEISFGDKLYLSIISTVMGSILLIGFPIVLFIAIANGVYKFIKCK